MSFFESFWAEFWSNLESILAVVLLLGALAGVVRVAYRRMTRPNLEVSVIESNSERVGDYISRKAFLYVKNTGKDTAKRCTVSVGSTDPFLWGLSSRTWIDRQGKEEGITDIAREDDRTVGLFKIMSKSKEGRLTGAVVVFYGLRGMANQKGMVAEEIRTPLVVNPEYGDIEDKHFTVDLRILGEGGIDKDQYWTIYYGIDTGGDIMISGHRIVRYGENTVLRSHG